MLKAQIKKEGGNRREGETRGNKGRKGETKGKRGRKGEGEKGIVQAILAYGRGLGLDDL